MTPVEYEALYKNLKVGFSDGSSVDAPITTYHRGNWDSEAEQMLHAAHVHFNKEKAKAKNFAMRFIVNGQPVELDSWNAVYEHAKPPAWGKGSPEDCQIAAQLAVQMNRTTKDNLARYCAEHFGLDCNGFVGNFLWHGRLGNAWNKTPGDHDIGPNITIDQYVLRANPVANLASIQPSALNIFGLVTRSSDHTIVKGGSEAAVGHIFITEPGKFTNQTFVQNSFGGLTLALGDIYGNFGLWAVESTGTVGLTDAWCAIQQPLSSGPKKEPVKVRAHPSYKVYKVYRQSKHQWDYFTIASLPLKP